MPGRRAQLPATMSGDLSRIRARAVAEVLRELEAARRLIAARLAQEPGDALTRQRLLALQADIERNLDAFRAAATSAATAGAAAAVSGGIAAVTAPLAAQGVDFTPRINTRALSLLETALTRLIQDISDKARQRINSQLAQVLIGTQPLSAAVTEVQRLLGGAVRNRARTIVYTEIGRIHSAATQASLEDAAERLPGLKKRWVKSGKKHPRQDHVGAHGQVVPVKEPFLVGGEKLMFPRDPKASARNTIKCGCRHIPVVDGSSWGKATVRMDMLDAESKVRLERTDATPVPTTLIGEGGPAINLVEDPDGLLARRRRGV